MKEKKKTTTIWKIAQGEKSDSISSAFTFNNIIALIKILVSTKVFIFE